MSDEHWVRWGARLTKERNEWKATAETQAARAEEFRVKCETAYREGYEAGVRAAEPQLTDDLRALITLTNIFSTWTQPSGLTDAREHAGGQEVVVGALQRAAAALKILGGARAEARRPVLASNPLDTRTPDYHQLVEDLSEAVREMLRQKELADAAEAKADQMHERALKAETKWHGMSALRTCADLNYGKALMERDEAMMKTGQALALSRRDNARALEAEREVQSLTARLEQMRGRAGEAATVVREQLAGMWNDALEAAVQAATAAAYRLGGGARNSHDTAESIVRAIRALKTPVDG